jgi:hypothetical protein
VPNRLSSLKKPFVNQDKKNCNCLDQYNVPKKWTQIYPQGTKEGDEEQRFFIALSRDPQYDWRSVAAISKESKLSEKRVEEILYKYYKKGLVFQSPSNESLWAYWERVPNMLPKKNESVAFKEQTNRIKKAVKKSN